MLEDQINCNRQDNSSDSEGDWENLDNEETIQLDFETVCLFCSEVSASPEAVFTHCLSDHKFDFVAFSRKARLDAISYIKLVNYIRTNNLCPSTLLESAKDIPWNCDKFMKPVYQDDPLLTFDVESFLEEKMAENGCMETEEEETIVLSKDKYEALLQKLTTTEAQLENAWDRIERLKETARNVICSDKKESGKSTQRYNNCDNDQFYFSSYDHFGVHHDMLQDKIRTLAYQQAIILNKEVFQNKVVMDVGCGTSILSMFAASAGARKVLAIDKSHVIYQAMDIIRENGFDGVVDLHKGRVEDVKLPEVKVDIIVSEWMGYFLLFEGMLDCVIYARNKYLSPGGLMFPSRCAMFVAAVSDPVKYEEYVQFWNNVYGYKMSVMRREVIKEANIESVKAECVCSELVSIKEFDLLSCTRNDTEFFSKFNLTMTKTCDVTSLMGSFDSFFEHGLQNQVVLSTSPLSPVTHWKQTIFLFPDPIHVNAGDVIPCRLSCRKNRRDPRTLIVKIDFGDAYNQYYLA